MNVNLNAISRVELAYDVIRWIARGDIFPEAGEVMESGLASQYYKLRGAALASSLKKFIASKTSKCNVCAKGAFILIKTIKSQGAIQFDGFDESAALKSVKEFPPKMLAEMEVLFERGAYRWDRNHLRGNEVRDLKNFSRTLPENHAERLIAICEMLIANKGEFVYLK